MPSQCVPDGQTGRGHGAHDEEETPEIGRMNAASGNQIVDRSGKQEGEEYDPNAGRSEANGWRASDASRQKACDKGQKHEAFVCLGLGSKQDRGGGQDGKDRNIEYVDDRIGLEVGPDLFVAKFRAMNDGQSTKDRDGWNKREGSPAEGHVKSLASGAGQSGLQDVEEDVGGHYSTVDEEEGGKLRAWREVNQWLKRFLKIDWKEAHEYRGSAQDRYSEEKAMVGLEMRLLCSLHGVSR